MPSLHCCYLRKYNNFFNEVHFVFEEEEEEEVVVGRNLKYVEIIMAATPLH